MSDLISNDRSSAVPCTLANLEGSEGHWLVHYRLMAGTSLLSADWTTQYFRSSVFWPLIIIELVAWSVTSIFSFQSMSTWFPTVPSSQQAWSRQAQWDPAWTALQAEISQWWGHNHVSEGIMRWNLARPGSKLQSYSDKTSLIWIFYTLFQLKYLVQQPELSKKRTKQCVSTLHVIHQDQHYQHQPTTTRAE